MVLRGDNRAFSFFKKLEIYRTVASSPIRHYIILLLMILCRYVYGQYDVSNDVCRYIWYHNHIHTTDHHGPRTTDHDHVKVNDSPFMLGGATDVLVSFLKRHSHRFKNNHAGAGARRLSTTIPIHQHQQPKSCCAVEVV